MREISVTELRKHLQEYLSDAHRGSVILVTSHGRVIARLSPPGDVKKDVLKKLNELRKECKIGDIVSPIEADWDANK